MVFQCGYEYLHGFGAAYYAHAASFAASATADAEDCACGGFCYWWIVSSFSQLIECQLLIMDDRVVITSALRLSSLRTVAKSPDTSCKSSPTQKKEHFSLTPPRQQRRRRLLDRSRM